MNIFRSDSTKLLNAIENKDGDAEINKILKKKEDLLDQLINGATPLFHAVSVGRKAAVQILLKKQANVDKASEAGLTPLHMAMLEDRRGIAQLLLEAKATVGQMDKRGETPLHIAAKKGKVESLKLLVEARADIDKIDGEGETPLHKASHQGKIKNVNFLLESRADVSIKNLAKETALDIARKKRPLNPTRRGRPTVITLLEQASQVVVKEASSAPKSKPLKNSLHEAAKTGEFETIQALIKEKAGVDQIDEKGATPLWQAAAKGHLKAAALLIEAKANVDKSDRDDRTPLFMTAHGGKTDIAQLLLTSKAIVDQPNKNGWTPLHKAAQKGEIPVAQLLLEARANINQTDDDDWTPLYVAAKEDKEDFVRFLLQNQADPTIKTDEDETALDAARENGNEIISRLLEPPKNTPTTILEVLQEVSLIPAPGKKSKEKTLQPFILALQRIEKEKAEFLVITTEEIQDETRRLQNQLQKELTSQKEEHDLILIEKAELEERFSTLEQELSEKASKADQQRIRTELDTVKEQLKNITSQVSILWNEYEIKAIKRKALQEFQSHPNLILFYRTINIRLEEVFISFKAVAGGFVDPVKGNAATAAMIVGCLGSVAGALPIIGNAVEKVFNWSGKALEKIDGIRQKNTASNASSLATIAEVQKLAESVARQLTEYYAEQLMRLATPEEAQVHENRLEKEVKKAKEAVLKSEPLPPTKQLAAFAMIWIVDQLYDAPSIEGDLDAVLVAQVADKLPPEKLKTFWNQVTKSLGMASIRNKSGDVWHPEDIFTLPGVKMKSPGLEEYCYYSNKTLQPEKFGWRLGSLTTVKNLGLKSVPAPRHQVHLLDQKVLKSVSRVKEGMQRVEEKARALDQDMEWIKKTGRVVEGAKVHALEEELKESKKREKEAQKREQDMLSRLERMEKLVLKGGAAASAAKPQNIKGRESSKDD